MRLLERPRVPGPDAAAAARSRGDRDQQGQALRRAARDGPRAAVPHRRAATTCSRAAGSTSTAARSGSATTPTASSSGIGSIQVTEPEEAYAWAYLNPGDLELHGRRAPAGTEPRVHAPLPRRRAAQGRAATSGSSTSWGTSPSRASPATSTAAGSSTTSGRGRSPSRRCASSRAHGRAARTACSPSTCARTGPAR